MSNHYRLEEVTASNDDGDTVIINRIYELKINHNLDSSIDGNIYQPSNKVIIDGQVIKLTLDSCFHHPKNKKIYSI
ncbi:MULTISPECIES: hypothetical protein [Acinetobacter]|uniref:Uncharacterized protein n=2 Tax=Acinetobacter TaxID=469 RepID=A0A1H3GQX1_9GAMM|nr:MULTISPECIES: hypothetical protein [Acinetobacter]KAB0650268.1 hypothetical protein F7P73_16945 [Acinetobacter bohemicus]CAD9197385.1 hypothetical protein QAC21B_03556 [Acinetobacter bohemicus]SDY05722.1 hypothetical protein SAMN05421643_1038 [Acinetobacter kyonggiensis]SFT22892.1 hypothetical protein SAMN05444586_104917 [Acinetobacter bohemicus]